VYNIDDVQNEYGKLITDEDSNDDMQGSMDSCDSRINIIDQNVENLKALKKEIDAYVHC
jgi:hypothetical protein